MSERGGGPRALAPTLARLTRPILRKRGFATAEIVHRWAEIVGPQLAARTMPERIAFPPGRREDGTLHLRVDSGSLALELQHFEGLVVERINGFFGYGAVARLRMVQRPLPPQTPKPAAAARTPAPGESADLEHRLTAVTDPDLRAALGRLGRAVQRRRGPVVGGGTGR